MHQNNPYCQEKIYQQLYNFQTKIITIQALPTSPNSTRKKRRKLKITRVEVIKIYAKKNKKKKKDQTQLYMQKKRKKKEERKKAIIELLHLYNRVFAWLSSTRKLICLVRDVFQNMF
jgi:valyl-tRNA synthetase